MNMQKALSAFAAVTLLTGGAFIPANADPIDYFRTGNRYYNGYNDTRIGNFMYRHPYVGKAVVGGAAGAAIGAIVTEEDRSRGAVKGALIGAGAGLGYEYLRQRGVLPW